MIDRMRRLVLRMVAGRDADLALELVSMLADYHSALPEKQEHRYMALRSGATTAFDLTLQAAARMKTRPVKVGACAMLNVTPAGGAK